MKNKIFLFLLLSFLILVASNCIRDKSIPTSPSNEEIPFNQDTVVIKKPNIYIYPTQEEQLEIKILFPKGGEILISEPLYENGWHVLVDTSGIINNQYRYLFYECKIPHHFQTVAGWIVAKDQLDIFLKTHMKETGFNDLEIEDCIEYWIPRLKEYNYYLIYPQYAEIINELVELQISKEPENIHRLYYLFKGVQTNHYNLETPQVLKFSREGYTVVEWGGMLLE